MKYLYTTPRTGSHLIGRLIANYLNVNYIDEYFTSYHKNTFSYIDNGKMIQMIKRSDNRDWNEIVSERLDLLKKYPNSFFKLFSTNVTFITDSIISSKFQTTITKHTPIYLERVNKIEQFLSFAIFYLISNQSHFFGRGGGILRPSEPIDLPETLFHSFKEAVSLYEKQRGERSHPIFYENFKASLAKNFPGIEFTGVNLPVKNIYTKPKIDFFTNKEQILEWCKIYERSDYL